MRLLFDAAFPRSLGNETPVGVTLDRWVGEDVPDTELIRAAAHGGYRGVLLIERDSLQQPRLLEFASDLGVALIAVEAKDPIEAKVRVLRNLNRLRRMLVKHDFLLILAREVRAYSIK